ncbi:MULTISPECIES: 4-(cytidine 5'-diphospho)-2-C-methyl-D-erythritol kinase [Rossellomorea]|jgi:4-diphosphocytidyl-2-C-methyl-D-erythritol kinase|uniref:4-diphosphocytidyl-2-C-methyl-D-erythritol kinase n=2 Tax=Rossellomorea vietnamensis TaxID=218284 RepID=A0A6I6UAE8_9BACI|nr:MULTISPECIES: 4-(cytidine 5'-diphospho)-2-C-methyl-D-erythritol kinase [Rossellomorea]OXS53961.1 4-(cytidine 5'-diphospho)-2-C-methyl-D-erythritol kinase [Bacillus sp. DSM 27956]PRX64462.1 4-diphosphocytidyl-2-C-methyl-D-erythritol kinase [Bacillus sp. V-88]MCA0151260.1 4-(cytidine 5'-diphospho)-2-C-methyl-D-erythritol kinase [Rossellomorea vietnamensis]QHE59674.1 4-(cytidine 5'-diphospho)-2-C-methyl-D-erythritol kinase [Rossellomorea vietnamensis]UXH42889.1 4-(cytidine 5'-diphospho)-2-C-me
MRLLVKAPAKINLSLDVLHKRSDGYHEVEMVMTTIDLADRIELTNLSDDTIKILSHNRFVPDDGRNLAYQAAHLLKEKLNIKKGVAISIDKVIPVAAGLAGGSSDAAATLKGLNRLWDLGLSMDELAELGAEIGSDVSFCVYGGTALASGRGEKIKHLPAPPNCWVILAKPTIGVSTADVYKNLDLKNIQHPDTSAMVSALEHGNYRDICSNLGNVLESVTLDMHPEVSQIKDQMERFGADAVLMSGSGPTVYGLVQYESRLHRIYNGLRGFCDQVFAVRMLGD